MGVTIVDRSFFGRGFIPKKIMICEFHVETDFY